MWLFESNSNFNEADIQTKIADYNKAYANLVSLDKKIGFGLGITAFTWGCTSWTITLLSSAAAGYVLYNYCPLTEIYEKRKTLSQHYQQCLNDLVKVYSAWAEKDPSITKNETFLALANTLAPVVSAEILLPWVYTSQNASKFSPKFMEILARPPHCRLFMKITSAQQTAKPSREGIFSKSKAEVNCWLYGYHKQEKPIAPTNIRNDNQSLVETAITTLKSRLSL